VDRIIRLFNDAGARYLLIGGQALRLDGLPRFTMDWDLLLPPRDIANIERINRLLADDLDMPLLPLGPAGQNFVQTYQLPEGILQFHLGGPGMEHFDELEARAEWRALAPDVPVRCLAVADLLAVKRAAGRPRDLEDAEFLEALLAARRTKSKKGTP